MNISPVSASAIQYFSVFWLCRMVRCSRAGRAVCLSNLSASSRCPGNRSSREPRSTYLIRTLGDWGDRSTLDLPRLGRSLCCSCCRSAVAGRCKRPAIPQLMRFTCVAGAAAGASGVGAAVASLGFAVGLV